MGIRIVVGGRRRVPEVDLEIINWAPKANVVRSEVKCLVLILGRPDDRPFLQMGNDL